MTWLADQKALRTRYDNAIAAATEAASVSSDGRTLAHQRIETLTRLRDEVDYRIAKAESGGKIPVVEVTTR